MQFFKASDMRSFHTSWIVTVCVVVIALHLANGAPPPSLRVSWVFFHRMFW